jgi:hypothetical protein
VRVETKPHASVNNDTTVRIEKTTEGTVRETGTQRVKTRMERRVKSAESREEIRRETTPSFHSRNEKLT